MSALNGKSILVTGGTGSFGRRFIRRVLADQTRRVVVLSRDELKQYEMRQSSAMTRESASSSATCATATACGGRSMASRSSSTPRR